MTDDKIKWSYLAGIIDGEGSISIFKQNRTWFAKRKEEDVPCTFYILQLQIANCDLRLMKWLIVNFGGVYYTKPRYNETWKTSYSWRPKGRKNMETLLLGVLPYLQLKRGQAKLALEFSRLGFEKNPEKRDELHLKCTELNRRGVSPTTNMFDTDDEFVKIESELHSDMQSELSVMAVA